MPDGRVSLIDFGQMKRLSDSTRVQLASTMMKLYECGVSQCGFGDLALACKDLGVSFKESCPDDTIAAGETDVPREGRPADDDTVDYKVLTRRRSAFPFVETQCAHDSGDCDLAVRFNREIAAGRLRSRRVVTEFSRLAGCRIPTGACVRRTGDGSDQGPHSRIERGVEPCEGACLHLHTFARVFERERPSSR